MQVKGELLDDLAAVASRWVPQLSDAAQVHLFDRLNWFELTQRHIDNGRHPLVAHVERDGKHAWLFLRRSSRKGAMGLASWYTLAFRPVFSQAAAQADRVLLVTDLARLLRPVLGKVRLEPVPEEDGSASLLHASFRAAGWAVRRTPKTGHWHSETGGRSFSDFWAARPGQLRSTHDRRARKFSMDIRIHTQVTDAVWSDYQQVFDASWKGEEGSPGFLRALAEHAAQTGTLRLGIARWNSRPVAAQLWTVDHGRAIIHKLAYREDAASMSPGTLLSAALFRHAIDVDQVATISYGTGDDAYKRDWMDEREQLFILEFFNPWSVSGLLGIARSAVGGALHSLTHRRKI